MDRGRGQSRQSRVWQRAQVRTPICKVAICSRGKPVQHDRSSMKFIASLLVAIVIALAAPIAAQSESADAQKSKAAPKSAAPKSPPMIFYLAKGDDDACGAGCGEWIAAEGQIEADTAQRLRAFLNRLGKRELPIFFHSPGGAGTTSTVMGRLLREREMT